MADLLTILGTPFVLRAIIAVLLISVNAAIAGTLTVFRRAEFLVAGVSHAALAGAALAIVLTIHADIVIDPLLGALGFALLLAFIAGFASRKGDSTDLNTSIGIGFAMSMSLAVVFISLIREYASRVWGILFGDLLLITERDLVLLLVATSLVVVCTLLFHREFVFISFDMEGAIAYGVRARALNYLMLGLIAVSIVVLLKGVGAILVFAMLVSPAATANRLARSVPRVFGLAFLLALFSGYCGLVSSFLVAVSPGAIASLIATALYFIVLTVRR